MPDMPDRRIIAEGKFIRMVAQGNWEFAERTHPQMPVGIIAVTDDKKLLLIEQFRIPVQSNVIEIPAGLVGDKDASEPFELAAQRELLEETGYTAQHIQQLAIGPSTAGMCSEMSRLVLATGVKKEGPAHGDGDEQITLHEIPSAQVAAYLRKRNAEGTPIDWKVYAACWFTGIPL